MTAAALLAVALGIYIPRQVQGHMLQARAESNRQVLDALLQHEALPVEDPEAGFERLDDFVTSWVVRGEFLRVKLWSPEGEILYSDERALIGRTFPPSNELTRAFAGVYESEVSDLSDPENEMERGLADKLLEFYLPVERRGEIVAVWEVYQSLDPFEQRIGRVRLAVWASVGSGLGVLGIFLVSSFGSLLAAVQQRRREAERRSKELAALLEVSRSVASLDPARLSRAAVATIQEEGSFRAVALIRPESGPERARVLAVSREPTCPASCILESKPGLITHLHGCASLGIELGGSKDRLLLVTCRDHGEGFSDEDRAFVETAGEQVRIALENARLYETLSDAQREQRRLTGRLVTAYEDERKRIVGEIHDGLGQDLHRVLFGLRGCRSGPPGEISAELARLEEIVDRSTRGLRRLLQDLRPSTLEDVGLAASLRSLVDQVGQHDGLHVVLRGEAAISPEPPVPVRVAVFRIAQEALRNVARHAASRRAAIDVARDDGALVVRISDEGTGLPARQGEGLGLWLMRERAEALGGTLALDSGPAGTTVTARIPVEVGR